MGSPELYQDDAGIVQSIQNKSNSNNNNKSKNDSELWVWWTDFVTQLVQKQIFHR